MSTAIETTPSASTTPLPASWTAVLEATRRRAEDVTRPSLPARADAGRHLPRLARRRRSARCSSSRVGCRAVWCSPAPRARWPSAPAPGRAGGRRCRRARSSCAAGRRRTGARRRASWRRTARDVRRLVREVRARPARRVGHAHARSPRPPPRSRARAGGPALLVRHVDFLPGPAIARLMRARRRPRRPRGRELAGGRARPRSRTAASATACRWSAPGIDLADYDARLGRWRPSPRCCCSETLMPWKRPDLALEAVARAARDVAGPAR